MLPAARVGAMFSSLLCHNQDIGFIQLRDISAPSFTEKDVPFRRLRRHIYNLEISPSVPPTPANCRRARVERIHDWPGESRFGIQRIHDDDAAKVKMRR